jgi:hypothetical protein
MPEKEAETYHINSLRPDQGLDRTGIISHSLNSANWFSTVTPENYFAEVE